MSLSIMRPHRAVEAWVFGACKRGKDSRRLSTQRGQAARKRAHSQTSVEGHEETHREHREDAGQSFVVWRGMRRAGWLDASAIITHRHVPVTRSVGST